MLSPVHISPYLLTSNAVVKCWLYESSNWRNRALLTSTHINLDCFNHGDDLYKHQNTLIKYSNILQSTRRLSTSLRPEVRSFVSRRGLAFWPNHRHLSIKKTILSQLIDCSSDAQVMYVSAEVICIFIQSLHKYVYLISEWSA